MHGPLNVTFKRCTLLLPAHVQKRTHPPAHLSPLPARPNKLTIPHSYLTFGTWLKPALSLMPLSHYQSEKSSRCPSDRRLDEPQRRFCTQWWRKNLYDSAGNQTPNFPLVQSAAYSLHRQNCRISYILLYWKYYTKSVNCSLTVHFLTIATLGVDWTLQATCWNTSFHLMP